MVIRLGVWEPSHDIFPLYRRMERGAAESAIMTRR